MLARGKHLLMDLDRTPHRLAQSAATGRVSHDPIAARNRWHKELREANAARDGHVRDARAVIEVMSWLKDKGRCDRVTELDIAARLKILREKQPGFRGLSMPAMVAVGPHAALAHYFPSAASSIPLGDHPLCWIDSGGQYFGCTTDNTVTIAIGAPEARHVFAHTLVLKGFIALATAHFPVGTVGAQLDTIARQFLWRHGLDYAHGTGHGVGNYLNVHEGPLISRASDARTQVVLEPGMIITNEPGYYAAGDFGVRLESHLLVTPCDEQGFLAFDMISCLPIDPELVDPALLELHELVWLAEYHRRLVALHGSGLTEQATSWLNEAASSFDQIAADRAKTA